MRNNDLRGKFTVAINNGDRYNKLTIVEELEPKLHKNGRTKRIVRCVCDCGAIIEKSFVDVRSGKTQSCGKSCSIVTPKIDITGKIVGKLKVLNISRKVNDRYILWNCICDCGKELEVDSRALREETKRSCGQCTTSQGKISVGDVLINTQGYSYKVLEILPNSKFLVEFEDEYSAQVITKYTYVKSGAFRNPYHRTVCGVGYYGEGDFVAKIDGIHTPEYRYWNSMMKRCYTSQGKGVYDDVEVCSEWHNFQKFAEWCQDQVGFNVEGFHLDKDLLSRDSREYSPSTCCFLPREINSFVKRRSKNNLPIGVDTVKLVNSVKYRAQGRFENKNVWIGNYDTPSEAFNAFLSHQQGVAANLANKWENLISDRAYHELLNYNLEPNI